MTAIRRFPVLSILAVAALLAACGGTESSSAPPPAPEAAAAPTAAAAVAPTEEPAVDAEPDTSPNESLPQGEEGVAPTQAAPEK